MKQKLTLSIQPEVIRRVKRVARERETTVSSLFEEWGSRVSLKESFEEEGGLGDALLGQWVLPENSSVDDVRLEYLLRKHGKHDARAG